MENARNKSSNGHSLRYQKDYTKLEAIFDAAVERSRKKKIIHYASDRLYSEDSRKEMARKSYKAVAWAEPIEEKDIHTELIDLANESRSQQMAPSEKDEKNLLSELMDSETIEKEPITSQSALEAYKKLKEQSNSETSPSSLVLSYENTTQTVELTSDDETTSTTEEETRITIETSPDTGETMMERYYRQKQEVLKNIEPKQEEIKQPEVQEEDNEELDLDLISSLIDIIEEPEEKNSEEENHVIELSSLFSNTSAQEESEDTEEASEEEDTQEVESEETEEKLPVFVLPFEETSDEITNEEEIPDEVQENEVESKELSSQEETESIPSNAEPVSAEESEPLLVEDEAEPEEIIEEPETYEEKTPQEETSIIEEEVLEPEPKIPELPEEIPTQIEEKETPEDENSEPVEAKEPEIILTDQINLENAKKDLDASTYSFFIGIVVCALYALFTYNQFYGFDYIGLVLVVIGIFLAWDIRYKNLLIMGAVMLVTLIVCMLVWVYQTRIQIELIHYLWFFFIPLCMGLSYSYINSKRLYQSIKNAETTTASHPLASISVPSEKLDLKMIINDLAHDEAPDNIEYSATSVYEEKLENQEPTSLNLVPVVEEKEEVEAKPQSYPKWDYNSNEDDSIPLDFEASLGDYIDSALRERDEEVDLTEESLILETPEEENLETVETSLEDQIPEENETEKETEEDNSKIDIPSLSDFITVEQFGLSEEDFNESVDTLDNESVEFGDISALSEKEEKDFDDTDSIPFLADLLSDLSEEENTEEVVLDISESEN